MVLETRISISVTFDLVVNREYYMPKHGYEFYLRVILDISLVRLAQSWHEKIKLISTIGHVIFLAIIEWIPLHFFKVETNKQEKTMIDSYILGLTLFVSALQKIPLHNCTLYDFKTFFETIITKIENHLDCSKKKSSDIQEISLIWKNEKQ